MRIFAILIFVTTLGASLVLTAVVRALASRFGLIDLPDGRRKLQMKAIPLGGGISIFAATTIVLVGLVVLPNPWQEELAGEGFKLLGLFLASALIVFIGLMDDRFGLRARHKLFGQLLAASILFFSGIAIERIALFEHQFDLGLLAYPFTLFWLLGAMNSVNLLDGIDGFATMIGIILVASFAVLAVVTGNVVVAAVALVFAGSLCGFLRFNFPPAKMFLGDAGSMLIGLVLGTLAIQGSLKGPGTVLLAVPLAVLTLPILDSVAAIVRRKLSGRSIYSTDRGHLHHRLLERLGSNRRVLAAVGLCCAVTSGAALVTVFMHNDLIAIFVCAALVVILGVTGLFGHAEFGLAWSRLRMLVRPKRSGSAGEANHATASVIRLQGTRQWEVLLAIVSEAAEKLGLSRVYLDLNLPMLHESFSVTWENPHSPEREKSWKADFPLVVGGCAVGRLLAVSQRNGKSLDREIEPILELADMIETQVGSLLTDAKGRLTAASSPTETTSPPAPARLGKKKKSARPIARIS